MRKSFVIMLAIAGTLSTAALAEDREAKVVDRLDASVDTLADMTHAADNGIPQELMENSHCVIVIPGMNAIRLHLLVPGI